VGDIDGETDGLIVGSTVSGVCVGKVAVGEIEGVTIGIDVVGDRVGGMKSTGDSLGALEVGNEVG